MNFSNDDLLRGLQQEELSREKEIDYYNESKKRLEKIKILIQLTKDNQVIYSKDGAILRVEQILGVFNYQETFNNTDQIYKLSWQGQYCRKKKKVGKWVAYWDKKILENVGGYYKDGQKQGLWKDLQLNYCDKVKVFETGGYHYGQKRGFWNYIWCDEKIDCEFYIKEGKKYVNWYESDEGLQIQKQIIYEDDYNKNGIYDPFKQMQI
ncbi:unnamed protein product [Paramecium sonneborni]|uniref:MORN repeat protein n=1 Tax=Paramecium sonneborni TaxID=65129 RepID=A0A8S1RRY4_9CILI|nr:unnamed protein product [Paramecium sonneborni]